MSKFAVSQKLGKSISEMLGLNPNDVMGVSFHFNAGEVAYINVRLAAHLEDATSIVDESRKYQWIKRPSTIKFVAEERR